METIEKNTIVYSTEGKLPRVEKVVYTGKTHTTGGRDEVVPFDHIELYAQNLPQATVRKITGGGHQLNNDLSLVAKDIKSL